MKPSLCARRGAAQRGRGLQIMACRYSEMLLHLLKPRRRSPIISIEDGKHHRSKSNTSSMWRRTRRSSEGWLGVLGVVLQQRSLQPGSSVWPLLSDYWDWQERSAGLDLLDLSICLILPLWSSLCSPSRSHSSVSPLLLPPVLNCAFMFIFVAILSEELFSFPVGSGGFSFYLLSSVMSPFPQFTPLTLSVIFLYVFLSSSLSSSCHTFFIPHHISGSFSSNSLWFFMLIKTDSLF